MDQGKFRLKVAPIGLLFIVAALASVASLAQTTSADLAAPMLRAHANLVKYHRAGPPLTESLAEAQVSAASRGIPWKGLHLIVFDGGNPRFSTTGALQLYRKLACEADVVAVGHTNLWAHHLSASGTTVYTDYVFVIDTLLKENRTSPIRSKPDIVVTRPGGSLLVNNDPVSFEFEGFPNLQSGTTYLQFLRYIPESSAYHPLDSYSTLVAAGNNWLVARKSSGVVVPGFTRGALETFIGNWLTSCKQ